MKSLKKKTFVARCWAIKVYKKMNKLLEEAKALNIPRRNLMKKDQLKQVIKDTVDRYKEIIFGSDVICIGCLNELKKQRKIDEYTHSKKLLEQTVRDLSCLSDHCFRMRTSIDEEMTVCMDCGLMLEESEVSSEGDFLSHKIKKR